MTSSANKKSSITMRIASDSLRAPSFSTRSFTLGASNMTFLRTTREGLAISSSITYSRPVYYTLALRASEPTAHLPPNGRFRSKSGASNVIVWLHEDNPGRSPGAFRLGPQGRAFPALHHPPPRRFPHHPE